MTRKHLNSWLVAALFSCCLHAPAQQASVGSLPTPLTKARTVFVGNGGLFSEAVYTSFCNALSKWNHFQIVDNPSDAELAFELQSQLFTDVNKGSSSTRTSAELIIRDLKTHALIWSFSEDVGNAFRKKTYEANKAEAVAKLVDDLKELINPSQPTSKLGSPATPSVHPQGKTRFSQTGQEK